MPISNPSVTTVLRHPGTEIWDGTSQTPAVFTDLDLSPIVGAREALVLLGVYRTGNDVGILSWRTNGATREIHTPNAYYDITVATTKEYQFLLMTDSAGIVEWYGAGQEVDLYVRVIAFLVE